MRWRSAARSLSQWLWRHNYITPLPRPGDFLHPESQRQALPCLSAHACGCFPIIRSYLPARPPAHQDWACQTGLWRLRLRRGSVAARPPAWARPGGRQSSLRSDIRRQPRAQGRHRQPPRLPTGLIRIHCNAFASQRRPLNISNGLQEADL